MDKLAPAHLTFFLLLLPFLLNGQTESYIIKKAPFSTDKYAEFSPIYYKNGIVFCSDREYGLISYTAADEGKFINLYYIDTTRNSEINTPVLFSKEITTKFNDGPVSFDASGNTVYYSRNIMVEGKFNKLSSRWNKLGVFSAVRKNGVWTNIRDLGLNSKMYNLITPSLAPDGKRLYFASDMPGGYGGTDLYYSERSDEIWGKPVNLGPVINSEGNESYPFINSKGEFFFSSERESGFGGKDIYFTQFIDGWQEPVLLAPPLNSEFDDFGLITDDLSLNGYFSSDRGNSIDIYHFTTLFPQVYGMNFQQENNYCYTFNGDKITEVDTNLVNYLWIIGEEKFLGEKLNHCFPGPGEYKIQLDIIEKSSGELFFRNSEYLLEILHPEKAYIHSSGVTTENETIEFNGMKSDLTGYTILNYAWDLGDNTRKIGPVVNHSYEADGEYDVNLFLTLKSNSSSKIEKTSVARKVIVFNTKAEKDLYMEEFSQNIQRFKDITEAENAVLNELYETEDSDSSSFFCLELHTSDEITDSYNEIFQSLPDKYKIRIRRNDNQTYSFTVLQQENFMDVYPSYIELRELGFTNARVMQIIPEDPDEQELFRLAKKIDNSIDNIFTGNGQLSSSGRVVLDQVIGFLKKFPEAKIEVSVHTDNTGYASNNLSTSQLRAKTLTDYLISKGIDSGRLMAWGYGGSKPIALNIDEKGRKKNRRVEFNILQY